MNRTHLVHTAHTFLSTFFMHYDSLWCAIQRCLYNHTNTKHKILSSPFHPQTNGLDECTNLNISADIDKIQILIGISIPDAAYLIGVEDLSKISPFFISTTTSQEKLWTMRYMYILLWIFHHRVWKDFSSDTDTEGTSDAIIWWTPDCRPSATSYALESFLFGVKVCRFYGAHTCI